MTRQLSRWFGLVVVVGVVAAGCGGSQPATTEQAPAAPKVATSAERVAWYQNCWSLFNSKSWEAFKGCYADEIESVQKDMTMATAKGPDAVLASSQQFATAVPDLKGALQLVLTSGDTIASLALMTGTNSGPLKGADGKETPATNKPIGYLMAHIVQGNAAGDKAIKEASYQDNGTFMNQLGLSPAPGRPLTTTGVASPVIVAATGSETERANAAAYRAQLEMFNKHDIPGIESFNAPDVVFHDQTQPKDLDSKGNSALIQGLFTAFPDAMLTLTSVWGAGDYTVAEGTFAGTNTAAYRPMGISKATGKAATVPFIEIVKWEGGKLKENWFIIDAMIFPAQLGLLPAN
ncbi:MAG: ester cyclase [Vicinamibacterales bacterium]